MEKMGKGHIHEENGVKKHMHGENGKRKHMHGEGGVKRTSIGESGGTKEVHNGELYKEDYQWGNDDRKYRKVGTGSKGEVGTGSKGNTK